MEVTHIKEVPVERIVEQMLPASLIPICDEMLVRLDGVLRLLLNLVYLLIVAAVLWCGNHEVASEIEKLVEVPVVTIKEVPVETVVERVEVVTVEKVVEKLVTVEKIVEVCHFLQPQRAECFALGVFLFASVGECWCQKVVIKIVQLQQQ